MVDFLQQTISEHRPFRFSDLTLKQRFLNPNAVILTGSSHTTQSFLSGPINCRNVICDEFQDALLNQKEVDTLRYFGMNGI